MIDETTKTEFPKLEELFPAREKGVVDIEAVRKHIMEVELDVEKVTRDSGGLPDLSGPPSGNQPLPDKSGYVNKGSFYSFVAGLNASDAADTLNSVLFAQAVADMRHANQRNTQAWYDEYVHWLSVQGWVAQAFSWKQLSSSSETFEMQDALLALLAQAVGTGSRLDAMRALFNTLKVKQDSPEYTLLDSKKTAQNGGGFQMGSAGVAAGDNHVVLPSLFSAYSATEHHHSFLWWHWSHTTINFYGAFNDMILNKDVWNQIKDQVIKQLGDIAKKEIGNVGPLQA